MQKMEEVLRNVFEELTKEEYENRPRDMLDHRFSLRFKIKMALMMLMHRTKLGKSILKGR